MNIEEAKASIGKFVMCQDRAPKAVRPFSKEEAMGPFVLMQITKEGRAFLGDGKQKSPNSVRPSLIFLAPNQPTT